jgi:hypothetical protein
MVGSLAGEVILCQNSWARGCLERSINQYRRWLPVPLINSVCCARGDPKRSTRSDQYSIMDARTDCRFASRLTCLRHPGANSSNCRCTADE